MTAVAKLRARAKLVTGFRIDVDDGRTHAYCLDLPPADGTDLGSSALELSLMSLAGCYATIFVLTAKKMRMALVDLEVELEAEKSEELRTIVKADLQVKVKTSAPASRIQRVHELTVRNCPVGILFEKAGVETSYRLETSKDDKENQK